MVSIWQRFYDNPFRSASVAPERIDMGVDYSGNIGDPVYALGPGVITEADNAWSGAVGAPYPGTFITERLTRGPLRGRYVYLAEDIQPNVSVGDKVDKNTVIGYFTGGGQSESGFAVGPSSPGTTSAMAAGQSATGGDPGAFSTGYGEAYNKVLTRLGAKSGITTAGSPQQSANIPTPNDKNTNPDTSSNPTGGGFSPLNPASWISTNTWERLGLIIFGVLLVLVGVFLLVGKQSIQIASTAAKSGAV